jgi:hypothetical protein
MDAPRTARHPTHSTMPPPTICQRLGADHLRRAPEKASLNRMILLNRTSAIRLLSLTWSMLLIALMATGTLSSARIGTLTWGPAHDIWSAAEAISQIRFGLSGNLAYQEVEQAIDNETTSAKNSWTVNDEATRLIVQDPAAVTRGFRAAAAVKLASIVIPTNIRGYITDWCEDLGYADFYNVAFRLFGFTAFSTHLLYFSILSASFGLFAFTFRMDNIAINLLNLAVTALFLVSATSIFNDGLPSFAANRFISTLAIIPLLHIICAALWRRVFHVINVAALLAQILIMWFATNARSSGNWCVIAIAVVVFLVYFMRRPASRTITVMTMAFSTHLLQRFETVQRPSVSVTPGSPLEAPRRFSIRFLTIPYGRTLCAVGFLALAVTGGLTVSRHALYSDRYYWEDNLPHHLIWHSAYLGLQFNPAWPTVTPFPYPDVPLAGDGAGFVAFEHWTRDRGIPYISQSQEVYSNGYYRARPYEKFIHHVFVDFALAHPVYMIQLYLYYKPLALITLVAKLTGSIGWLAWLFVPIPLGLASVLFAVPKEGFLKQTEIVTAMGAVVLCSLLPSFWAYPAAGVASDEVWCAFFILLIGLGCFCARFGQSTARATFARLTAPSPTDRPAL